jgi:hypothetical protein
MDPSTKNEAVRAKPIECEATDNRLGRRGVLVQSLEFRGVHSRLLGRWIFFETNYASREDARSVPCHHGSYLFDGRGYWWRFLNDFGAWF